MTKKKAKMVWIAVSEIEAMSEELALCRDVAADAVKVRDEARDVACKLRDLFYSPTTFTAEYPIGARVWVSGDCDAWLPGVVRHVQFGGEPLYFVSVTADDDGMRYSSANLAPRDSNAKTGFVGEQELIDALVPRNTGSGQP